MKKKRKNETGGTTKDAATRKVSSTAVLEILCVAVAYAGFHFEGEKGEKIRREERSEKRILMLLCFSGKLCIPQLIIQIKRSYILALG